MRAYGAEVGDAVAEDGRDQSVCMVRFEKSL